MPKNLADPPNAKSKDAQDSRMDLSTAADIFSFANDNRIPIAARLDAMKTVHAFAKETNNDVKLCQILLNGTEMPPVGSLPKNKGQNINAQASPPTVPNSNVEQTNIRRPSESTNDSCWEFLCGHKGYNGKSKCGSPSQSSQSINRSVFVGKVAFEGTESDQGMLSSRWASASGNHDLCLLPHTSASKSLSPSTKSTRDAREGDKISSIPNARDYPDLPSALFCSPSRDTFGQVSKNRINTSLKVTQHAGGKSHATMTTTIPGIGTFSGHGSCQKAVSLNWKPNRIGSTTF
jgi:hypothetical protein